MRLPNWFKIAWWVFLTVGLSAYFVYRFSAVLGGRAQALDSLAFIILTGLLLLPLVSELKLLGVLTLKQEVEALRTHVDHQLNVLRSEIHNVVGINSQVSPQFHFASPPPDSQLPALQQSIRETIREVLQAYEVPNASPGEDINIRDIDEDVAYLFAARFQLEREMRRAYNRVTAGFVRPARSALQMAEVLLANEVIDRRLFEAIREVYSVSSAAIHGREVTPARVAFVRETAPGLIRALEAINQTSLQ